MSPGLHPREQADGNEPRRIFFANGTRHRFDPRHRDVLPFSAGTIEGDELEKIRSGEGFSRIPVARLTLVRRSERFVDQVVAKHGGTVRALRGDGSPEKG